MGETTRLTICCGAAFVLQLGHGSATSMPTLKAFHHVLVTCRLRCSIVFRGIKVVYGEGKRLLGRCC